MKAYGSLFVILCTYNNKTNIHYSRRQTTQLHNIMKATPPPKGMCTKFASVRRGSKHMLRFLGMFTSRRIALRIVLHKTNLWNI